MASTIPAPVKKIANITKRISPSISWAALFAVARIAAPPMKAKMARTNSMILMILSFASTDDRRSRQYDTSSFPNRLSLSLSSDILMDDFYRKRMVLASKNALVIQKTSCDPRRRFIPGIHVTCQGLTPNDPLLVFEQVLTQSTIQIRSNKQPKIAGII